MKKAWMRFLGYVITFMTIFTGVVGITINFRPLYVFDITYLKIPETVGLSKTVILENFQKLMNFLNFFWVKELKTPDFPMSEAGYGHFVDVKQLFILDYVVFLLLVIPCFYFLRKMIQTGQKWRLNSFFKKAALIPLLLGGVMALGFNTFFVAFHQLFFSNDDWLFDPRTDPIILALPEEFFMHSFILAFVLLEGVFLLGLFLTRDKKALKN